LFLIKDILFPLDAGGKIRTFNVLKQLNKTHEVDVISVICPGEERFIPEMEHLCRKFIFLEGRRLPKRGARFVLRLIRNAFSRMPYTMMNDCHAGLKRKIMEIAGSYDLLICDFLFSAPNCLDVKIPKLLFQHNVESMIPKRHAQNARGLERLAWGVQYRKTRRMEECIVNQFDYVMCVSETDARFHREVFGVRNVGWMDLGVDAEYYHYAGSPKEARSLVFTGGMDWRPNADAVRYFHEAVFPKLPGYRFYAVGKNPSKPLMSLSSEHFIISGRVPDVRPYLHRAETYVVPLRVGGGTRIKIFEAMAAGLPVVSTSLGAEGLPVRDGDNILIRDSPNDFAKAIRQLSEDPAMRAEIAQRAYDLVTTRFSWEKVCAEFVAACERTGGAK
jgi:glycosyltransferase involved in cell wall biosynthesis